MVAAESTVDPAPTASETEIRDRLVSAVKLTETINKRLERETADAEKEKEKARREREELKPKREEIDCDRLALDALRNELEEAQAALDERERTILERETDADRGFTKRHIQKLKELNEAQETLRKTHEQRIADLEEEEHRRLQEVEQRRKEWEDRLESRAAEVDTKEAELRKKERELRRERMLLAEDQEALNQRVEESIARERESFAAGKRLLEAQLASARESRDEKANELLKLEEVFRCFHPKSPEDVLIEMKSLKESKRTLEVELENRLSSEAQSRLQALERDKETSDADKADLRREISSLKTQLAKLRIAATELETARRQIDAYEANIDLLKAKVIEETRATRELVEGKKVETPFPSLSAIDSNENFTQALQKKSVTDLKKFAAFVRKAMAQGEEPRYYDDQTVRSFIGGMAMSRLHILHGISGTGKTSLPLAFAKAVGAGVELIEVQAGWRDRDDLFGYYNSFEKKFYESKFLQALYKAQSAKFRNRPFLIVLDEMNLSHAEQYFADILSALENPDSKQLTLMTSGVQPCPEGLVEEGKSINLPDNVWFIGTANQDETTKDFADKTYDRAHVMELQGIIEPFSAKALSVSHPIDFSSLQDRFRDAQNKHKSEADAAWEYLNHEAIRDLLRKDFEIGWGPRLQRQLASYLPVVIACGGSKGEALDHLFASKILRKLKNRYNNRIEHLQHLMKAIEDSWLSFDGDSEPGRCLEILKSEERRIGGDV